MAICQMTSGSFSSFRLSAPICRQRRTSSRSQYRRQCRPSCRSTSMAGDRPTPAVRVVWRQWRLWPKKSHWSRPYARLLYAAQRTFTSQFTSQHFEQLLPTRGNHRLQSSGYLCPPRAHSSACRQIVSCKSSRLSHVRPEMQTWGAPPRSNTENSTGPPLASTPGSAFRKGLRQPSAESPALPPGVYRGSRRR